MVNIQSPSGKEKLKHSGLSEEQLENLIQKIVIAVKKDAQGDSHSSQPVPPAYPPSVLAGLDPPPPFVKLQELISIPASLPSENIKLEVRYYYLLFNKRLSKLMKKENIFPGFQESIQYLKMLNSRGIMNRCPLSN